MSRISIQLFGSFAVTYQQQHLQKFRSTKAAALLAYLAVEADHLHTRERLIALLWPSLTLKSARTNLRQVLYQLRTAIPQVTARNGTENVPLLISDYHTVQLNPDADMTTDVTTFEQNIARVQRHSHSDIADCEPCSDSLTIATELFQGAFLSNLHVADSNTFEDWVLARREGLQRQLLDALQMLGQIYLAQGRIAEAEKVARRQLALDNLREDGHRQLIEAVARSGRRNQALAHYDALRQLLWDELGVSPTPATLALLGQVERQAWAELRDEQPTRNNLPVQLTPFIGRKQELSTLNTLLTNPDIRLITIVAPGGMGKTRLAIEAAREQCEQFRDGVCFVSLAAVQSGRPIVQSIVDALGLTVVKGETPVAQQLTNYLRPRQLLLILDNFEHLTSEARYVSDLLQQAANVIVLVTSRVRLNLSGESVMELAGLPFPDSQALHTFAEDSRFLDSYQSAELFVQAAQRSRADYTLPIADYPAVAKITQLVGGIPLGIELAAAWVNVLTAQEITDEIEESIDILESQMQNVPTRHRSLRATFDYSWKLLSKREQQIFPKLAVFHGGFSRLVAKDLFDISLRDLQGLVNKSLLQRTGTGRFDLHPLMQQYAADILNELGSNQIVRDAHCAYFVTALQDWGALIIAGQQQPALSTAESDIDNVWAAWEWAIEHQQVDWIEQALCGLAQFLFRQNRFNEGLSTFISAENALKPKLGSKEMRVCSHAMIWRALFEWMDFNEEKTQIALEDSWHKIEAANATGEDTRFEQALHHFLTGRVARDLGNWDISKQHAERSLALLRDVDHEYGISEQLLVLAWVNRTDTSHQYYQESLALKRQITDWYGMADQLAAMAVRDAFWSGNIERAIGYYEESHDLFQQIGDPGSTFNMLRTKDELALIKGHFSDVLALRQSMTQHPHMQDTDMSRAFVHRQVGEAYYHLGKYEQAERELRLSLSVPEESVPAVDRAFARWQFGLTLFVCGQAEEAKLQFLVCVQASNDLNAKSEIGRDHVGLACVEFALGNYEQAWEHVIKGIRLLLEDPAFFWMFYALGSAAVLLAQREQVRDAIAVYAMISRYDFVASSIWFEDAFGQQIEASAAHLSAEEVQSIRESSQTLDVWQVARALVATDGGSIHVGED